MPPCVSQRGVTIITVHHRPPSQPAQVVCGLSSLPLAASACYLTFSLTPKLQCKNRVLHTLMEKGHRDADSRSARASGLQSLWYARSFGESFSSLCPEKPWVTKLSSAGLIYLHFGRRVLEKLTSLKPDDRQLEVLYDKLYENFVEEVDAVDNGISQYDGEARYAVSTTLSARVGHLNPRWNSKSQDTEEGFRTAMGMVGAEFLDRVDPSGEIIVFGQGGCPWKEHLFSLEKEMNVETPIKFVLYPDQSGQWRVQCVPAGLHTFQNR
ncbi:hypothetical protein JZ751_021173 [Albula glossodonta]|uniref:Uncharacterized protein n=1 Tax=Albula glossodonta TaxID=121402 RepID=A0A8T2NW42_9TELE|nr:hypothetical protein JZ751_021173 [Albula glossodonta]